MSAVATPTISVPSPVDVRALQEALARPFEPREVKWLPRVISGSRAMALAYVDARVIQDRLDEVLGLGGWSDDYDFLPGGGVVCRLRCRFAGEWILHTDVGSESEQPDEGDRRKASVSDALKRAAVKFGVGRYLYRLPAQWVDYDAQKKQFVKVPTLPPWAQPDYRPQPRPPADGAELEARLRKKEADLVRAGLCAAGDLLGLVAATGAAAGLPHELARWDVGGTALELVTTTVRDFERARRATPASAPTPTSSAPAPAPAPSPAADPEAPEEEDFAALDAELLRTGVNEPRLMRFLRLPRGTKLGALTRQQVLAAVTALRDEPDATVSTKA